MTRARFFKSISSNVCTARLVVSAGGKQIIEDFYAPSVCRDSHDRKPEKYHKRRGKEEKNNARPKQICNKILYVCKKTFLLLLVNLSRLIGFAMPKFERGQNGIFNDMYDDWAGAAARGKKHWMQFANTHTHGPAEWVTTMRRAIKIAGVFL